MQANNLQIGKRLKEERKRLGLTQAELAQKTNVSVGSQTGYESGRPPNCQYLALAEQVGINIHYVISGKRPGEAQFDWSAHNEILMNIENWLKRRGKTMTFNRKMDVLRLNLSSLDPKVGVNTSRIHKMLEMMT
jgi:transcriptional regulator with XRE-family HTH domain